MFKFKSGNIKRKSKKTTEKPRYQKIVTSVLYVILFVIIAYTFWEFNFVGESVNSDIYSKTLDVLVSLLGITGGMKISENITDAIESVAKCKYSAGSEMRGGE